MKTPLLFILLCYACSVCGQENTRDPAQLIPKQKLVSDFLFLKKILDKAHPSLYRYTSEDTLKKCFNLTLKQINRPMAVAEFWMLIQPVITRINSGHTTLFFDPLFIAKYNEHGHNILPFHILINKGHLYIKDFISARNPLFKPNDEIISIEGIPATAILTRLYDYIPGDGYSMALKNFKLESGDFNRLYEMLYPHKEEYQIVLTDISGQRRSATISGIAMPVKNETITVEKTVNHHSIYNSNSTIPDITFFNDSSSSALLTLSSFEYPDHLQKDKTIFNDIHEKKIKNLIIDLRNNTGGNDFVAIDLLNYLFGEDFYFTKTDEAVTDIEKFKAFTSNLSGPDTIQLSGLPCYKHDLHLPANSIQHPYPNAFNGNLFLITNNGTFSAASLFAVALKAQRDCEVIGQETGGGESGCDGGSILTITLPNTLLKLSLPLLWTYSMDPAINKGHGLIPDKALTHSVYDETLVEVRYFVNQRYRMRLSQHK